MPIHETEQGWILETRTTGYALGLKDAGLLTHRYWGMRQATPDGYPTVPSPAGWSSFDPAAQMTAVVVQLDVQECTIAHLLHLRSVIGPPILRWFDRWLKEADTVVEEEPPVLLFVMGVDQWRTESAWPLPDTQYRPYYLHSAGRANSLHGDGTLSAEPRIDEPPTCTCITCCARSRLSAARSPSRCQRHGTA